MNFYFLTSAQICVICGQIFLYTFLSAAPKSECGQGIFHVGREWRLELHLLAGGWIGDRQAMGVKGVAIEQAPVGFCLVILADFAAGEQFQLGDFGSAAAIELVAEHGMVDVGQVDANLVGAAGAGQGADQRVAGETLDGFEDCYRLSSVGVFASDGFLFALCGVVADRLVDDVAVAVGDAQDDGQVFFFHFA